MPTKSQILATQAKMRAQAKLKNGGKSDAQMRTEAKMRAQAAKTPVVAKGARTPPKPAINPKLKPGAPGGPPKSPGQLAFEAKERQQKAQGTGRFSPIAKYLPEAKESVEAENLPALNEITRAMSESTARGQRDISQTQQRGAREQANLGELFARLGNFQGQIQTQQQQNYQTLKGQAGTAYEQLENNLNQTYDGAQAKAAAEAQRLGLGNVTGIGEAFARGQSDQDYNVGRAKADSAALQGGFTQQSQGFDQLMALTRANTGAESASRQAVSQRETNASVDELQFELQQRLANLEGQKIDIKSTEGARIQELARALEEKTYSRTQEQAQQQFNNMIATEQLGLSKNAQQFSQSIARKQQALAEMEARMAANQTVAGPSELEILQVAKLRQEIMAEQAQQQAAIGTIYRTSNGTPQAVPGNANGVVSRGGRTR